MSELDNGLGQLPPSDDRHRRLFALTDETVPRQPTPVVAGWVWWTRYDAPFRDAQGRSWLVQPGGVPTLGHVRGGHCICLISNAMRPLDLVSWWKGYDQGSEGACVGFGSSRACSIMNRVRYDGFALYHRAQQIDEWPGENYDGTSVRAGMDVLRKEGAYKLRAGRVTGPLASHGILENRWTLDVADMARCLSPADEGKSVLNDGFVILKNSWNVRYPFETYVDLEDVYRATFKEDGEMTVITDRPGR